MAGSLTLRQFLQIGLDEWTPDHVTLSRTRRLIDEATHQQVFGWVLKRLARVGFPKGKTIGIDSTLEANAAMKSMVRREGQENYTAYLYRLARAEGVEQARNFASRSDEDDKTLASATRKSLCRQRRFLTDIAGRHALKSSLERFDWRPNSWSMS